MNVENLVTTKEIKAYDNYTIRTLGVDSLVLMERAALAVMERILALFDKGHGGRVLIVCGTGNNGGDGLCLTRLLVDKNIPVTPVIIGDIERGTYETRRQFDILCQYGVACMNQIPEEEYAIVVDALFGVGLSREISGVHLDVLQKMNSISAYKIAIDIPSGINGDNGSVMGEAFMADETLTIAFVKRGMVLFPGNSYCGRILKADIGITSRAFASPAGISGMFTLQGSPKGIFERRVPDGNKGTYGKLLIAAGSENMAGAALMSALSAYKCGAGMVKLVIPEKIRPIVQEKLPEALILVYQGHEGLSENEKEEFCRSLDWADAVVAGPGLSVCKSSEEFVKFLLAQKEKPLLLDADALNILSAKPELMQERGAKEVVLTPHMGELARLLHCEIGDVTDGETEAVATLAERMECVVVGKSARTYVLERGQRMFLNTAGNDRMATAGSGDVLTGMIGTFLAQGMKAYDAAVNGVYLHACAGDAAYEKAGHACLCASDIIEGLSML